MKTVKVARRAHELGFFRQPLDAAESVAIDIHDPRFLKATDLAQAKDYAKAADAAIELLGLKHYDVRLLGYPLLQDFFEDGPAALPAALELLDAVVQKNMAALRPVEKRELLLNKTLVGYFQTILDALDYRRLKDDSVWKGWMHNLEDGTAELAADRAQTLGTTLSAAAYRQSGELLSRLSKTMRDLGQRVTTEHAAEELVINTPDVISAQGTLAASPSGLPVFAQPGQTVQIRGSAKFIELCNKLRAFELLVEKRDFRRAAMVSNDILAALASFDPRVYFPELFATFGAMLSAHVASIKPHWDLKDTVEWKMLEQFYRVDLENFTTGE